MLDQLHDHDLPADLLALLRSAGGVIDFETFMEQALYSPSWGYYTRKGEVFGGKGDFVTAPEMSGLFAQSLAHWMVQQGELLSHVLELGPGRGLLAQGLLSILASSAMPRHYDLLELSGTRIDEQRQRLAEFDQCRWLPHLPEIPIEGIVIANEVLDAMPVSLFWQCQQQCYQGMVALKDEGVLDLRWQPADASLTEAVAALAIPEHDDYQSEINRHLVPWFNALFAAMERGMVWLCDYGFPQRVFYHPDRCRGTLMCHYQHRAHTNPLIHPGRQDITAHVNFTAVAEAADEAGFHVSYFGNQADFLLANGLLAHASDFHSRQAVKMLTMPQEMGELFYVMILTKDYQMNSPSLSRSDKRHTL